MHVVATNIIIWIRTLIKESLHEITESEEEAHKMDAAIAVMKSSIKNVIYATCQLVDTLEWLQSN